MLFNDYPFLLVFLPAALLITRLADPYPQVRIGVQVALSLAFYAWGSPSFIVLLIASNRSAPSIRVTLPDVNDCN